MNTSHGAVFISYGYTPLVKCLIKVGREHGAQLGEVSPTPADEMRSAESCWWYLPSACAGVVAVGAGSI